MTKRAITGLWQNFKPQILLCGLAFVFSAGCPVAVSAEGASPPLIRDTEIETNFQTWLEPLRKVSGINEVNIVLVQSSQVNAFVAGGKNIFIYTGLIDKTDSPSELLGVMAHEMGHIAGGHLVSNKEAMERASYESILAAVLGVGAAVASGNGQAAQAIILGGNSMAERGFLAHSRVKEASADQAGFRFLDDAHMSANGLASFLGKLESEELLPATQQSEYMRTHPITRDRVDAVEALIVKSAYRDASDPAAWQDQHARIKAKLLGFIAPEQVAWVYNDRDMSIPARYARAIAAYRLSDVESALKQMDTLLHDEPDNPYFQELKGQMLVEFGRVPESLPYYKKAVALRPDAPLLHIALAHALIESGEDKGALQEAIPHLQRALEKEQYSPSVHRLLATAYGRLGQENMARLELAEEALLQMKLDYAKEQAENILKTVKHGSPEWVKARDILSEIESVKRQMDQ